MSVAHRIALDFFRGLLWPAVAGNVLWSFASLAMKATAASDPVPAASRIALLLLLGFYLSLEWIRNYRNLPDPLTAGFWIFDAIHLLGAVVIALAAYDAMEYLHLGLVIYLAGTGLGHALGVYRNSTLDGPRDHLLLAFINLIGLPFVALSIWKPSSSWFSVPATFAVPLAMWLFARRRNIAALTRPIDASSERGDENAA